MSKRHPKKWMVSRRSSANNSAKKATWCSQQLTTSPYLARGWQKGVAVTSFIRLTKVKVYNKLYHLLRAVTLVEFLAPTTNRQADRQLTQINRSFQDIRQHQHLIGGDKDWGESCRYHLRRSSGNCWKRPSTQDKVLLLVTTLFQL